LVLLVVATYIFWILAILLGSN